ncbi:MAG: NTP/NDP exchange transporter [Rickettsiaceae bacterium]|nr:NTP/NDP exchange transporter [Rickettsiaceae bacterium]
MIATINRFRNSRVRQFLLPIKSSEFAKFVPMALLVFMILLNQNVVRTMKDSILNTMVAPEVISFVKLWGEMPIGICFVILYSKMCNLMTTEKAFRLIVSFFLGFFALFAFVLFPNSAYFHPDPAIVSEYIQAFPHQKWFIVIWGKWTYVLFYIMGELWPVIIFSLLFWQLANKITKITEASRFYMFFGLVGQTNLLISGMVVLYFQTPNHCFMFLFDKFHPAGTELLVKSLTTFVIFSGMILLLIHYYIEKVVMSKDKYFDSSRRGEILKLGTRESFKMTIRSKYLLLICVLMIGYGMCMNLIEGVWMSKIRDQYSTPSEFMAYQGAVFYWTGVFAFTCSLCGSTLIKHFGWVVGAAITPVMIATAGALFFISVSYEKALESVLGGILHVSPLLFITFIGGLQNVLGKGVKYSFFDATKEMAYIPLDSEMKTKGKAAVDIIGNKIGKSTGALIQFSIFTIFTNVRYDDIALFLGTLYVGICVAWLLAVIELGKEYKKLVKEE